MTDPGAALDALRETIDRAEQGLTLSLPLSVLPAVEDRLVAAIDRDVLVLLLLVDAGPADAPDVEGLATVVRRYGSDGPFLCTADYRHGVTGHSWVLTREEFGDKRVTAFTNRNLAHALFGEFLGNYWPLAREVYTAPRDALPRRYTEFRRAVLQAALHLRERDHVTATATVSDGMGGATDTVTGPVTTVRQSMVYPITSSFPVESTLVLRVDGERVSVGGEGAYLEDHEADAVELSR